MCVFEDSGCLQHDAYFDVRITHPAASVLSRSEAPSQLTSIIRTSKEKNDTQIQ